MTSYNISEKIDSHEPGNSYIVASGGEGPQYNCAACSFQYPDYKASQESAVYENGQILSQYQEEGNKSLQRKSEKKDDIFYSDIVWPFVKAYSVNDRIVCPQF